MITFSARLKHSVLHYQQQNIDVFVHLDSLEICAHKVSSTSTIMFNDLNLVASVKQQVHDS